MNAREFFDMAREASFEIDRIRRQLDALDHAATKVAAPNLDARTDSGSVRGIDARIVGTLERREALERRLEEDYAIIDRANAILYGADNMTEGLQRLCPSHWWADAIALHYLTCLTWYEVGAVLGFGEQYTYQRARAALDIADAYGMCSTIAGRGIAEEVGA